MKEDKLKAFIEAHRDEFDVYEPSPDLWSKIQAAQKAKKQKSAIIKKGKYYWLRYLSVFIFLLLGAVVAISYFREEGPFIPERVYPLAATQQGEMDPAIRIPTSEKERNLTVQPSKKLPPDNHTNTVAVNRIELGSPSSAFVHSELILPVVAPAIPLLPEVNKLVRLRSGAGAQEFIFHVVGKRMLADTLISGVKKLIVENSVTDVKIKGNAEGQVTTHGEFFGSKNKGPGCHLSFSNQDSVLTIKIWYDEGAMPGHSGKQGTLSLIVPARTEVTVKNSKGNILVEKMVATECVLKTTSGSIRVMEAEGKFSAESTSGKIRISKLRGDLDVNNNRGSIDVDTVYGSLKIGSSSGNFVGRSVTLTGNTALKLISGNISLELLNHLDDLSFHLESLSGFLNIDKNGKHLVGEKGRLSLEKGRIFVEGSTLSGSQEYK
jgi:hypothetical protein